VLERVLRWRGRTHLYDKIDGPRTALVVIDMQNHWIKEGCPGYAPGAVEIVPNINRLAAGLRSVGGAIVWVRMSASPEILAGWNVYTDFVAAKGMRESWSASLTEGNVGMELWHELDVHPSDEIVTKTRYSALIQGSSDLDARLREKDIGMVIITGVATNTCCEATARDANMLNFRTIVVSDANAARSDFEHNASLTNLFNLFADVMTTDEVLDRLHAAPGES
jgi:ureidoacrylate peracid hydrolase